MGVFSKRQKQNLNNQKFQSMYKGVSSRTVSKFQSTYKGVSSRSGSILTINNHWDWIVINTTILLARILSNLIQTLY